MGPHVFASASGGRAPLLAVPCHHISPCAAARCASPNTDLLPPHTHTGTAPPLPYGEPPGPFAHCWHSACGLPLLPSSLHPGRSPLAPPPRPLPLTTHLPPLTPPPPPSLRRLQDPWGSPVQGWGNQAELLARKYENVRRRGGACMRVCVWWGDAARDRRFVAQSVPAWLPHPRTHCVYAGVPAGSHPAGILAGPHQGRAVPRAGPHQVGALPA
jgi:hypothetical protein